MDHSGAAFSFSHERLDVWQVAVQMCAEARWVSQKVPRGYRPLADQMKRSAMSTTLSIAEGAYRRTAKDKAYRYTLACSEAGETAAAAQAGVAMGLLQDEDIDELLGLAARVVAMLTRLVQRFG